MIVTSLQSCQTPVHLKVLSLAEVKKSSYSSSSVSKIVYGLKRWDLVRFNKYNIRLLHCSNARRAVYNIITFICSWRSTLYIESICITIIIIIVVALSPAMFVLVFGVSSINFTRCHSNGTPILRSKQAYSDLSTSAVVFQKLRLPCSNSPC